MAGEIKVTLIDGDSVDPPSIWDEGFDVFVIKEDDPKLWIRESDGMFIVFRPATEQEIRNASRI